MTVHDVRTVLRHRYAEEMATALGGSQGEYLRRLAARDAGAAFTQKELVAAWKVSQPAVSLTLSELQRHGYVSETDRLDPAGRGRPQTLYALTGAARLIFDDAPTVPATPRGEAR